MPQDEWEDVPQKSSKAAPAAAVADKWEVVPWKGTKGAPTAVADEWEDWTPASRPTQLERDTPGTGVNLQGAGTAFWETAKGIPGAIVKQLDPTRPFRQFLAPKHPEEMPIVQAVQEAKAGWQRGKTSPYGRLGEATISGLGSLVGMSASRAAEHGERGEGGAILGEAAVPVAMLGAGELLGRGVPAMRRGVGGYIHDPVTGKMTPGARLTGKIGGGAAGFLGGEALGLGTGMEHTGIAPYVGARLGAEVGPSLMERMFPEPASRIAKRAEGAAYEQRAQDLMRRGKEQEALDRKAARRLGGDSGLRKISPFEGMASSAVPGGQNLQLPSLPQGQPTPFPIVQRATEVARPTGSTAEPFEPLVWGSPEEAAAHDIRMQNLQRQAKAAGTYHAAQGAAGKRMNLQQRIQRTFGSR